jgi:biotin carboxylase
MRIVLSNQPDDITVPGLETRLAERGEDVLVVVPQALEQSRNAAALGRYRVRSMHSWNDLNAVGSLATGLADAPVESVTTIDERCKRAAAQLGALLRVPAEPWKQAATATDKLLMKEALTRSGFELPVAPFWPLDQVEGLPALASRLGGWPLIVKPRIGAGSVGTTRIGSPDEFTRLLLDGSLTGDQQSSGLRAAGLAEGLARVHGGLLAEGAIDVATEYHVELLRFEGREEYCLPGRYFDPFLGAGVIGSVLLREEDPHIDTARSLARGAADALGLHSGFAHVELLRSTDGQWYVGELGLRPGGARIPAMLALQHGIDVPGMAADLVMGIAPQVQLRPHAPAVAQAGAVRPRGLVTSVTPPEEVLACPGVVHVEPHLHVGDLSDGPLGSIGLTGYVLTRADTPEQAEAFARAALGAWKVTTAESVPQHSGAAA